jgi:predicted nucleotide-binding protein
VTRILDQQFVAHLYTATAGPGAQDARRAVEEIWRGCALLFGMTAPIAGTGLPARLPDAGAVRAAAGTGSEVAIAAAERPGTGCQAVLRLYHDVLSLSVGLVPPEATAPSPDGDWPWWRNLDYQWNLLAGPHAPRLLGEARLFLTRVDAANAVSAADPALYTELSALLPAVPPAAGGPAGTSAGGSAGAPPGAPRGVPAGVPVPGGFAIWEDGAAPDDRVTRRLVIAIAPDADQDASAWAWSESSTAMPPLARYLLHAAKVRYELRVWRRDSRARYLGESLDSLAADLLRPDAAGPDRRELFRRRTLDAIALHSGLLAMRRTVEIAADNLGRAVDLAGLAVPGSLFADDAALARWLAERLDDEAAYLGIAADRAERVAGLLPPPGPSPTASAPTASASASASATPGPGPGEPPFGASAVPAGDDRRNVFVIYGRDAPARHAVFDFLRALGLRPLEWEELVKATGKMAPFLSETVRVGLGLATAVVVLLTPEDVVHLHPGLREQGEPTAETEDSMQARPNVLLELGMALDAKPEGTLVLVVGEHRPVTDLGGMSYVRLTGSPECRSRIADRLKVAGCLVNAVGTDWLTAGDFAGLAAQHRKP